MDGCRPSKVFVFAVCVHLLMVASAPVWGQTAGGPTLFSPTTLRGSIEPLTESHRLQMQTVTVDATVFGGPVPHPERSAPKLSLTLFDDHEVTVIREAVFTNPSGSLSWTGKAEHDPLSSVVFVTRGGITVGSIRIDGRLTTLHSLGNGVHVLYEIDEDSPFYFEDPPTEVAFDPTITSTPTGGSSTLKSTEADDGSILDLMVVYTPAARSGAGGTVAMENLIDLGVTETNLSYANSLITPRLRLVHTEEVVYTSSGSSQTDRDRLRIDGDGFLDEVHPMRDAYAADLVKLVVEPVYCGIAYIMTTVSTSFEEYAFCVTSRGCISPNYTFGHELGHIQSARHDWFVDSTNNSPYTYNHGFVDPADNWRTVMAYSNDCGGCTRTLYWSNPAVLHPWTSTATGIPEGSANAADNHKTLNNTAWTVANFRDSSALGIFADGFESGDTSEWTATNP